jgi:hypothetical protein
MFSVYFYVNNLYLFWNGCIVDGYGGGALQQYYLSYSHVSDVEMG